ncbi:MAG: hypothetical protein OQL28_13370 [Sedimenticola sp.]|nr:hypothetical protein [Sedimenticola sp.]
MSGLRTICGLRGEIRARKGSLVVICMLFLQALLLLASPSMAHAAEGSILVVSNGKAAVYSELVSDLQSNLAGHCDATYDCPATGYSLDYRSNSEQLSIPPDTVLIITLGAKAAQLVAEWDNDVPVVHALISKASNGQLVHGHRHLSLFLDQPISRQLRLARLVRQDPRLGVLLGPSSKGYLQPLRSEADHQGIPMSYRQLGDESQVGPLLKELLEENNILLALPDPLIFNRKTIFNILLSSYHNKVPVIGFSAAYVKAGALIAAFSSPRDIASHLADIIRSHTVSGSGVTPGIMYPKYFSIAINHSVARSLGISLPDEADIVRLIRQESDR